MSRLSRRPLSLLSGLLKGHLSSGSSCPSELLGFDVINFQHPTGTCACEFSLTHTKSRCPSPTACASQGRGSVQGVQLQILCGFHSSPLSWPFLLDAQSCPTATALPCGVGTSILSLLGYTVEGPRAQHQCTQSWPLAPGVECQVSVRLRERLCWRCWPGPGHSGLMAVHEESGFHSQQVGGHPRVWPGKDCELIIL